MPLEESRNLRLSVELSNALESASKVQKVTSSEILRRALTEYLSREIRLSHERRNDAIEFANPATSPDTVPSVAEASDEDLAKHWGDFYGTDLRTA
ncbi:CopG family transcriptional regulator [Streptomyces sp. NPDC002698]|uniref:ribbon-helix-helix domain-containing protein n=1 Tax=Streptomyces sp. NPDC002698 TaxID=3364660 RepID=UPI003697C22E